MAVKSGIDGMKPDRAKSKTPDNGSLVGKSKGGAGGTPNKKFKMANNTRKKKCTENYTIAITVIIFVLRLMLEKMNL